MKVILTGSTGFIGQEVLDQCLQNTSITSVVALLRRELPESVTSANPKLKVVIMKDFKSYPDHVLQELEGANACIWSLGKASVGSIEEAREMTLDYTLAGVQACSQIASRVNGQRLRFVYLSGRIAERDQTKSLWFMQEPRRIRGQLETELISFANDHQDTFESYIVKPSMVLNKDSSMFNSTFENLIATVRVNVLAKSMIDIAVNGSQRQTFENSDIVALGT